jgi:hypothetical protein
MGIIAGFGTLHSDLIFEVEGYLKHIGNDCDGSADTD